MNKKEFLKAIENVTKTDSINPISAYNSINVEDLANAVDRFKKVPTYDELLKENQEYKEVIDKAIEYINNNWDGCSYTDETLKNKVSELNITELLDILKEVE